MHDDIKDWLEIFQKAEDNFCVEVPKHLTESEMLRQLDSATSNWERRGDFIWFEDSNKAAFFRLAWGNCEA